MARDRPAALPPHVPGPAASLRPLRFAEEEMLREGGPGVVGRGPAWHPTLVAGLDHPTFHGCPAQHRPAPPSTARFPSSLHPHSSLIGRPSPCSSSEKSPSLGGSRLLRGTDTSAPGDGPKPRPAAAPSPACESWQPTTLPPKPPGAEVTQPCRPPSTVAARGQCQG